MYFDLKTLQTFHLYWRRQMDEECIGGQKDMAIMQEDAWLQDSAVIEMVEERKGQWQVSLVFADPSRKSTFIVRHIRLCPSFKNAQITASFMRRVAAKDPRGTIEIDADSYPLFLN